MAKTELRGWFSESLELQRGVGGAPVWEGIKGIALRRLLQSDSGLEVVEEPRSESEAESGMGYDTRDGGHRGEHNLKSEKVCPRRYEAISLEGETEVILGLEGGIPKGKQREGACG